MQAIVGECIAKEGATDEDAAEILEMLIPQTRTAMCLNACIMEKTAIVSTHLILVFHICSNIFYCS